MKITHTHLAPFIPALRTAGRKTLLHVGCGTSHASRLPDCFKTGDWNEIRLDIDPNVKPNIVASLTDMSSVADQSAHAVWSSHSLEHLEDFEVTQALAEIYRVLKTGGFFLVTLPDLEIIAELIKQGKGDDILYTSPAGPITPMDMLFGHKRSIERGNVHMAHRTGFTSTRLRRALISTGFHDVRVMHGKAYDLWAVAVKDYLKS